MEAGSSDNIQRAVQVEADSESRFCRGAGDTLCWLYVEGVCLWLQAEQVSQLCW